jgi:SAM-dependent methyltransferase
MPLDDALAEVRELLLDQHRLVRGVAAGRRRGQQPSWRRVELRPVEVKAGARLQVAQFDEQQARTVNVKWGPQAEQVVNDLVAEPFGNWHIDTVDEQLQLRVTKRGEAQLHRAPSNREAVTAHDRRKPRVVDPSSPFLFELGVTTSAGAVKAGKKDKYHQVEEYVRALRPVVPAGSGRVRVVDLGCGNAYLTFATYAELASSGRPVELVGVDVKEQSRSHNESVATRLGWDSHVHFVQGSIAQAPVDVSAASPVDVAMALHACDTATDDALARAVRWQTPVVLAAPCCHHDLQRRVAVAKPEPTAVGPVLRFGLLRERQVDLLTDAWRALVLRLLGYRVEVLEFVDSRHTPRNALLRAAHTGAPAPAEVWREHDDLKREWRCEPYLAEVLAPELAAARER